MPQLCAVSGSILDVGLQPSPGLRLVIRSARNVISRSGDDLVLPGQREIDVPEDGRFTLSLVSGVYFLDAFSENGDAVSNARFVVPEAASASLEDIIYLAPPPPIDVAEQAVLDAQAAAAAAEAFADAAEAAALGTAALQIAVSIGAVSASRDLTLADAGKLLACTDNLTLTIPPQSSVAWPDGAIFAAAQTAQGITTVAAGSGVQILSVASPISIGLGESVSAVRVAENLWLVTGAMS